jgi:hypothetical protein
MTAADDSGRVQRQRSASGISGGDQRRRPAAVAERYMITSGSFMSDWIAGEVGGFKSKPASEAGRSDP